MAPSSHCCLVWPCGADCELLAAELGLGVVAGDVAGVAV